MLLSHDEDLLDLALGSIRTDLTGSSPIGVALALGFVANLCTNSTVLAEAFACDIAMIMEGKDDVRISDFAQKSEAEMQQVGY